MVIFIETKLIDHKCLQMRFWLDLAFRPQHVDRDHIPVVAEPLPDDGLADYS